MKGFLARFEEFILPSYDSNANRCTFVGEQRTFSDEMYFQPFYMNLKGSIKIMYTTTTSNRRRSFE